tara:strand:+ start:458 stop:1015 length:558 start_codon:yes stop_codon:yes gene_type:complete
LICSFVSNFDALSLLFNFFQESHLDTFNFVRKSAIKMGRLHTHNHGKSHSIRPIDLKKPDWVKQTNEEIEALIVKYAKDGMTASQIGLKLRDQHAIPLVKPIIKKTITDVLKDNKLIPEIPEDLNNIVMKAVNLQKHLKDNKSDSRNVRALELVEAKVHRLSTHYKKRGLIDQKWKYKSVVAQLE